MTGKPSNTFVISVLVADRVGILRDITTAVSDLGANIDGISQTVVRGYFTVILTATFDRQTTPVAIRDAMAGNFESDEAEIMVRPHDAEERPRESRAGERYIVTLTGRDRKGLLKRVTSFLAAKGVNIEDWYFAIEGENVTHIGEVTVPDRLDIKQVQDEFSESVSGMDLVGCIQHENLFRATNEIGPIRHLLEDGSRVSNR